MNLILYPIGRPVRATITLYPIGRPVRATITLYPIGRHYYIILQVLIVSLLTGIISYPNEYTRMDGSKVIFILFSECGPEDNNDLWWVYELILILYI